MNIPKHLIRKIYLLQLELVIHNLSAVASYVFMLLSIPSRVMQSWLVFLAK